MKTVHEAVLRGEPIGFTPMIDVHTHFGPWQYAHVPYAMDQERFIAEMDRYGCDMVWTTASDPGHTDAMEVKNDYVFDFAARYPDRVIPYCSLSANDQDGCLAELKRCLGRGRCIGVKMHRYQQVPYTLRADFLQPVFELLGERRLVYLNHDLGEAETVEWAAQRYPEVVFVAAHFSPAMNDLALRRQNCFDCICAAMQPDSVGREVLRLGRSDTMLLGSDFGLANLAFGLGMVAYAEITEQDKRNILGMNALRVLERVDWFDRAMIPKLDTL